MLKELTWSDVVNVWPQIYIQPCIFYSFAPTFLGWTWWHNTCTVQRPNLKKKTYLKLEIYSLFDRNLLNIKNHGQFRFFYLSCPQLSRNISWCCISAKRVPVAITYLTNKTFQTIFVSPNISYATTASCCWIMLKWIWYKS